jgi:branched-chain amino acid transport system substrate-binding protein
MKTKKIALYLLVSVIFMMVGVFPVDAKEVIRLGTVQPLTGGGSLFGLMLKQGLTMAFEEVNAKGGVNGKEIELIIYDSSSKPSVAISLAQRLIYQDKVPLILGSGSSLDNIAMMDITEREKLPLLIPSATSPKITAMGAKWVWRSSLTDTLSAKTLGDLVKKKSNWKKVAFLNENTEYGRPPIEILKEIIEKLEGKQVVAHEVYNKGDTDVSAQLLKIKNTNPDILITWGYYTEGALIARQAQQIGLKAQLFGNQGLDFPEYLQLAGKAAEGVMIIESTSSATNPNPNIQAFVKRFEAKYKRACQHTAVDAYDGAMVAAHILKEVGTKAEDIKKALGTMTFQGIAETIKFDATGQAMKGMLVFKVVNGEFKLVE